MCSHYQADKSRKKLERMGVTLPLDWVPPPGSMHIYPTQVAPIIRRPPERDSGDDAVPDMELVPAHFAWSRSASRKSPAPTNYLRRTDV